MSYLSLVFLVLCLVVSQQAPSTPDGSLVNVLSCKWTKARRAVESGATEGTAPARAMIPANKNFQRNVRANDPVGARDPNEDTLDGRSAAMEKNVQESRSPSRKLIDGFLYHVKVQNASAKTIDVLFWEYQITDPGDLSLVTQRQFLCGVEIRPGRAKELEGFSGSGPGDVVSVGTLANKETNSKR